MNNTRPTKKQRELLSFIQGFIANHGYGPSYREIMRALDYRSVSTVAIHVDNLIAKGHLRKKDHSARSLEVCNTPYKTGSDLSEDAVKSNEKCLTEIINNHFSKIEKGKISPKEIDQLNTLVNALRVLGFEDAAELFRSRLRSMIK